MILLTTAIEADRTGRRYGDKIDPDERVDANASTDDTTLLVAVQWLRRSSGCGKGAW